jgi:hypothetical protein
MEREENILERCIQRKEMIGKLSGKIHTKE